MSIELTVARRILSTACTWCSYNCVVDVELISKILPLSSRTTISIPLEGKTIEIITKRNYKLAFQHIMQSECIHIESQKEKHNKLLSISFKPKRKSFTKKLQLDTI